MSQTLPQTWPSIAIQIPDADPDIRVFLAVVLVVFVILIILMARTFIRNAVELRRDVNKRFDDLSVRLADEAKSTIEPLLEQDLKDKTS